MKAVKTLFQFLILALLITSCAKDPDSLSILTITAEGNSFMDGSLVVSDLNGATSPSDVVINPVITVTFDRAVDASTINTGNLNLTTDAAELGISVVTSGSEVKITPQDELIRGTLHTLTLTNVLADDGGALPGITRTFTTEGRAPVVVPNAENMIAYWTFDNTPDDETGDYPSDNAVDITYGTDRYEQENSSAVFDGDKSIIEIPNADRLMDGDDMTISFWLRTNSTYHQDANGNPAGHFVFGLGAFFGFQFEIPSDYTWCKLATGYRTADGNPFSEDLWFNGSGEDKDNGGWQGWDFVANLTGSGGVEGLIKDEWAHVVCSYDAASKRGTMFINGELMKSQDFNLWPAADPKATAVGVSYNGTMPDVEPVLAFGFIKSIDSEMWASEPWGGYDFPTANHFKGKLDDFRVFDVSFSPDDAAALYDAEKF